MGYVTLVALLLIGVLGASDIIIAKKPNAKELIGKLAPIQGWLGAICAIWGAWWTISFVLNIGGFGAAPVIYVTWLVNALVMLLLGLLLGIGTIKTFIKNPTAQAKMDEAVAKVAPYRGMLGIIALGLVVWYVLVLFVIY